MAPFTCVPFDSAPMPVSNRATSCHLRRAGIFRTPASNHPVEEPVIFKSQLPFTAPFLRIDKLPFMQLPSKHSRSLHILPDDIWGHLQVPRNIPVAIAVDAGPKGAWPTQKARFNSGGFANDQPCFRVPTNNPAPLVLGPDFRLKASVQMHACLPSKYVRPLFLRCSPPFGITLLVRVWMLD